VLRQVLKAIVCAADLEAEFNVLDHVPLLHLGSSEVTGAQLNHLGQSSSVGQRCYPSSSPPWLGVLARLLHYWS